MCEAERPHASIAAWAVLECHEGDNTARHIVGYILAHGRLNLDGENYGEPYIGTPLTALDVASGQARNQRGKLIALVGDRLPPGAVEALPADIQAMLRRAESAWGLTAPVWLRVE